ncbi:MAG: hypothetical protein QNK25_15245 [Desulfobacterales bacterium]|nr:hypothetical protein [Desulfobacterales bacterium]
MIVPDTPAKHRRMMYRLLRKSVAVYVKMTKTDHYAVRCFSTVDLVPRDGWLHSGLATDDIFFRLDFLQVVEATLGRETPMEYFIVYDGDLAPVAKGVLTQINVDALSLAPVLVRRIVVAVRRLFPRFLRYQALACGFPFWGASSPLRLSDDVDFKRLAIAMGKEFNCRARVTGSSVILIHDFTAFECKELAAQLCNTGYLQASSLPDQIFPATFDSLQSWLAHMHPQYRQRWGQVMERFSSSGLQMRHTDGNAPISELFNSDVHHQHVTISKDWEAHFVDLPVDFFMKLSECCPDAVRWSFSLDGDKVVGFVFGIMNQGRYYNMYLGHIPAYNESSEL